MKYKLTLTSDNYLNGGRPYRPVINQFETEEEFKKYVAGELAYGKNMR
jgi:hypothetical protein